MTARRVYVFNQSLADAYGTEVYHLEERTDGVRAVRSTLCGRAIWSRVRRWSDVGPGETWVTTEAKALQHKLRLCKRCEGHLT